MNLFSRVKRFLKFTSEEKLLSYTVPELKSIFLNSISNATKEPPNYPIFTALTSAEIPACYSKFLIDIADTTAIKELIGERFLLVNERLFHGLTISHFQHQLRSEDLIFCLTHEEFNSATIRLITNSSELLDLLSETKISVPPPWVAFEGYNPSWWGGNMQGAQGYYNDNYFLPYFLALTPQERNDYYTKYSASDVWIGRIEMYLDC